MEGVGVRGKPRAKISPRPSFRTRLAPKSRRNWSRSAGTVISCERWIDGGGRGEARLE